MLLSPSNDQLFLLPHTKSKTLLLPSLNFFTFPKSPSKFIPKPLICHSTADGDAQTLPHSAIQRIAQKLRRLGYVEDEKDDKDNPPITSPTKSPSPGQIFVPLPTQLPKYRVGHTLDPSWSTPENPVPEPGSGSAIQRFHELRRGAIKERIEEKSNRKANLPTLAELTLPKGDLRRLQTIGIGLKKKLKVGKAGITEGIVNGIHERWRRSELVKITCEDICRMNMKRTHLLLERKTGGLVIWRSGSNILLYRGADYKYPYFVADDNSTNDISEKASRDPHADCGGDGGKKACSSDDTVGKLAVLNSSDEVPQPPLIQGVGTPNRVRFQLPGEELLTGEVDSLLEGLGPRFTDWWGYEPLPVDADLLPAVIPGYRRPFRLLPYGVKPKLTNDEMTILKRLGRPLPCHFALGRNRRLQGLAASIVKLWEKCEIAKIAVKRGVQNTNSEMMAEELKRLTGGTLLSRDKEFVVLYRGKDFLPAAVSSAIEERRKNGLDGKEKGTGNVNDHEQWISEEHASGGENNGIKGKKIELAFKQRQLRSTEAAIETTSAKLSQALAKKARAEKILAKLGDEEISEPPEIDKEGITEEERHMLRKVGLRMKPFLLMGRRGVFAGTIENMHLHWKYRELVKIITGGRSIEEVHGVARTLEAESGGILVAVERVSKGYAIIVYRGKNYTRPASLRPQTLLSKREAMKRSIEAQRRESLKLHVLKLTQNIDEMKLQLGKDEDTSNKLVAEESKPELVKEKDMEKMQSAESGTADATSEESFESFSVTCSSEQDLQGYIDSHESEPLPKPVEIKDVSNINEVDGSMLTSSSSNSFKRSSLAFSNSVPISLDIRTEKSSVGSQKTELRLSVHGVLDNGYKAISSGATRLSNKERLLLRKQALTMKKSPLFAIGKSNIVTGVAEAIKAHFRKHPLAIVNVKGRAKGTSVQEVVVQLEEATGAVLVSQEPSKVILYRGWGAGEEPTQSNGRTNKGLYSSSGREGGTRRVVSPELISAIRLECGL